MRHHLRDLLSRRIADLDAALRLHAHVVADGGAAVEGIGVILIDDER